MIEMDLFSHAQIDDFNARLSLGAELPWQSDAADVRAATVIERFVAEVLHALQREGEDAARQRAIEARQLAIPGAL